LLLDLEGVSSQFASLDVAGLPLNVVKGRIGRASESVRGATGILIRPDGYVAWASSDPAHGHAVDGQLTQWLRPFHA
jgi:hypothetical protein